MSFSGPEGIYEISFRPISDWDGVIDVAINGFQMRWNVDNADEEDGGGVSLGGLTSGSEVLWNDQFWFELRLDDASPCIRYWGDRVIWREDGAA